MNQKYGASLAVIFLFGLGLFNIAKGIQSFRKRKKRKWIGLLRVLFGLPFLVLPYFIYLFLKSSGQLS